jgi:hypothetical protein
MPPKFTLPPLKTTKVEYDEIRGFPPSNYDYGITTQSGRLGKSVKERAKRAKRAEQSEAEAARVRENQERDAASYTLGIPPNSSILQINQAYRRLAKELHPDKCLNDPNATANFQKLLEAHAKLTMSTTMPTGGNKCRNRRRTYHITKKTQTHRHAAHHRKTHRVRD